MTKQESIAYLRKKALLEQLALATDTNPEAAKELSDMEKTFEPEEKDLTTEDSNVS